jgi:4-carboxymuconolactone decarboxylase
MTHFAVAEALNGSAVTWMEEALDDEYRDGQTARR